MIQAVRGKVAYSTGVHAFAITWKLSPRTQLSVGIVSPQTKLSGKRFFNSMGYYHMLISRGRLLERVTQHFRRKSKRGINF